MSAISFASYLSPNYEPLYRYLAQQIAASLHRDCGFRVGTDFNKFQQAEDALVVACGWWYAQSPQKYEPLLAPVMQAVRYNNLPVYFVAFVSRSVSPHTHLDALSAKTFGFNEEYSLSGYQALVWELEKAGQNLNSFTRLVKTGSHLKSLEALLKGEIDCATFDSTVLDLVLEQRPELRKELYITASFGPYPAPPLLVKKALEADTKEAIIQTLLNLSANELQRFGIKQYQEVNHYFYSSFFQLTAGLV